MMLSTQFYTPNSQKEIYISGDFHYRHRNLCYGNSLWQDKSKCRRFDNEIIMSDCLVNNINDTVGENDILIHEGDWSFGGKSNVKEFRDRINCKNIVHLLGNHCHHIRQNLDLQSLFVKVLDYNEFSLFGFNFIMCHYPIMSWNNMSRKSLMLHGHCHHSLKHNIPNLIDVGIDGENYGFKPVHISEFINMYTENRANLDHHSN